MKVKNNFLTRKFDNNIVSQQFYYAVNPFDSPQSSMAQTMQICVGIVQFLCLE